MVPILVIAFILVPLAELAVLIAVGDWIGLVPTLILLLVVSVVGAWPVSYTHLTLPTTPYV